MEEPATDRPTLGANPTPSERRGRVNAVSADLSEIFSAVDSLSPTTTVRDSAARALPARQGPPREPRSRVGALGVAAAVVLVGAAIGVLVTRKPAPPTPSAAPPAQALTVRVTPPPAAPTAPTLSPTVVPEPVVDKTTAPLVKTLPPLPPQPSNRRVTQNLPAGGNDSASGIEGRTLQRPAQTRASTGDPCAFLSATERARCLFPAIDDADRRLRVAYELATDAGAPSRLLSNYRQVWLDLRRRADREPYLVLDGYEALTDELNGYAADPDRFNG